MWARGYLAHICIYIMKATIRLFPWELDSIPEYTLSLPTATTLWKMWKREIPGNKYVVGQYIPHRDSNIVGIRWHNVTLMHGPIPRYYNPPDWSNYARWKREKTNIRYTQAST